MYYIYMCTHIPFQIFIVHGFLPQSPAAAWPFSVSDPGQHANDEDQKDQATNQPPVRPRFPM